MKQLEMVQKEEESYLELNNQLRHWENSKSVLIKKFENTIQRVEITEKEIQTNGKTEGRLIQVRDIKHKINTVKGLAKQQETYINQSEKQSRKGLNFIVKQTELNKKLKNELKQLK